MSVFIALSDPVRRDILQLLLSGEKSVGGIVEVLGLAQPSVSKHLKALQQAGLVQPRVEGHWRYYRLDPAPLEELERWLVPYRTFWAGKLDALGDHLKRSD